MKTRLELQSVLEGILGSKNVYFQPPTGLSMKYPAIVYSRNRIDNRHANNGVYHQNNSYQVIVIDKNPDSEFVRTVSKLPMCNHDRHYTSDNLNHDVFTLYF